jgi:hypothetical protein
MGLPMYQERILHGMETALRTREPRLTAKFAIFTRLTRDEEIPRIEQLQPQPWLSRQRAAALVLVTAMLLVVVSVFIAVGLSSTPTCGGPPARMPTAAKARGAACTVEGAGSHSSQAKG